jgi:cobalt-zinc-cadmium efflux system outer membrane protein
MEIARAGVARAEVALQRARREPIPNVTVMTGVQKNFASHDTVANVQMELPIPLYNRNRGAIYQAQSELSAAHGEVGRVELSLHSRLADTYQRYANARQQVERYAKNILPNAKDSLDLVGAGYKQGEFSFLAVLMAQRTYFQTNMAYIDALAELWDSAVAIEGLLLRDSLQMSDSGPSPSAPSSPAASPSMMK